MAGICLCIADFQAECTGSGLLLNIFQLFFRRSRFFLSPEIPIFIDLFKIRIFQKIGGRGGMQEQNDSCHQQKKHFFHKVFHGIIPFLADPLTHIPANGGAWFCG